MPVALFFIAIIPNPGICAEVKQFKLEAKKQFQSSHALRSPAHITLQPPFKWDSVEINKLESVLLDFVQNKKSFFVGLEGFGSFPQGVVFINVEKSNDLVELQAGLEAKLKKDLQLVSDRPSRDFYPHMTIAFKDLKRPVFPHALTYFSEKIYQSRFKTNTVFLLKHNGKVWEIFKEYPFR